MWDKRSDMIVHEQDPFNAEPPVNGLLLPLTSLDSFYVRNHGPVPDIDIDTWRLKVDGLVGNALELTLADIKQTWPHHTVVATMQCAGNRRADLIAVRDIPGEDPWGPGATSTARWTGVRLADVLRTAGAGTGDRHIAFAAPDVSQIAEPPEAYGGSIELPKALSEEVLLAWAMNDEPLPQTHGGPLRVVVPGYIGARSVKWLRRITVQEKPSTNYFQATAYRLLPPEADPSTAGPGDGLSLGPVALNAAILEPDHDDHVVAGPVTVKGYAYAGEDRHVARVDLSSDGGHQWVQADLDPASSAWTWQHWRGILTVGPGRHELVARAWDSTGASQPELPQSLWNPKGYINNSWARINIRAV